MLLSASPASKNISVNSKAQVGGAEDQMTILVAKLMFPLTRCYSGFPSIMKK